uniref:Uncharacterized protein n=1 Tax=Anguilla anguilla TaxID=7936 RepID=A0A0E9R2L1_ANGAN
MKTSVDAGPPVASSRTTE